MFLCGFIFYYFCNLAHKEDLKRWSAEAQAQHTLNEP